MTSPLLTPERAALRMPSYFTCFCFCHINVLDALQKANLMLLINPISVSPVAKFNPWCCS